MPQLQDDDINQVPTQPKIHVCCTECDVKTVTVQCGCGIWYCGDKCKWEHWMKGHKNVCDGRRSVQDRYDSYSDVKQPPKKKFKFGH